MEHGEKIATEIQVLKKLVGDVLKLRQEQSGLSKDQQAVCVVSALTTLAANATLEDGKSEGAFFNVAKTSWDWVQGIYNLKKSYDSMTPEERQAVIAGKLKLNPDGTRSSVAEASTSR